jgi:hypothetical protein
VKQRGAVSGAGAGQGTAVGAARHASDRRALSSRYSGRSPLPVAKPRRAPLPSIPQEYGGSGLSLPDASALAMETNLAGGNSGACHSQMYMKNAVLCSNSQTRRDLPAPAV